MNLNWENIILYRRFFWFLFLFFIPYSLVASTIFKNQLIINTLTTIYVCIIGIFLKQKLYKEKCPNCHNYFFSAWGDLLFSKVQ